MPNEIHYIQCDCEKGRLEEIAETKVIVNPRAAKRRYWTIFYGCDSCSRIFMRTKHLLVSEESGIVAKTLSPFERYYGLLSKGDIRKYALKYETLDMATEGKIIAEKAKIAERKLEKRC